MSIAFGMLVLNHFLSIPSVTGRKLTGTEFVQSLRNQRKRSSLMKLDEIPHLEIAWLQVGGGGSSPHRPSNVMISVRTRPLPSAVVSRQLARILCGSLDYFCRPRCFAELCRPHVLRFSSAFTLHSRRRAVCHRTHDPHLTVSAPPV